MSDVDRAARDEAAALLRRFISGKITNFDFEEREPRTKDRAVSEIWAQAWYHYDDVREHRMSQGDTLLPSLKREIMRWILFLDSDVPYSWPEFTPLGEVYAHAHTRRDISLGERLHPIFVDTPAYFPSSSKKARARSVLAHDDFAAWPFRTRHQVKQALRTPRRLSGRIAA